MGYKIIIAGGGTGGHIFPAIAIANALKKLQPDMAILFVGAKNKMEMEKVPQAGYEIKGLQIAGWNRNAWWKNILLPFKILKSLRQASIILKQFKPDIVIGVGGYASFPMLYMAQQKNINTLIQEQNSYAGKTNQTMGKKAKKICVAFNGMGKFLPAEKIVFTGNPVRKAIAQMNISKEEGCLFFHLNPVTKTVLSVGGSLGAKSINEAVEAHLDEFVKNNIQLIWQTGKLFFNQAIAAIKGKEHFVKVFDFLHHIEYAYAAADVIISRAGAIAISELCIVKKPAILVPYPFAAEDHQTQNALSLVHKDAALMVKDNEAKSELVKKTMHLLKDEKMQEILINNIAPMGIADADERIAEEVLQILNTTK